MLLQSGQLNETSHIPSPSRPLPPARPLAQPSPTQSAGTRSCWGSIHSFANTESQTRPLASHKIRSHSRSKRAMAEIVRGEREALLHMQGIFGVSGAGVIMS